MNRKNTYIIGAIIVSVSLVSGAAIGGRIVQAANAPTTEDEAHAYQIQQNIREANDKCKSSVTECAKRYAELQKETAEHVKALGGPDNLTFGQKLPVDFQ